MSKKPKLADRDKRARLDLELFVIALIERGVNTPYALQARADVSPGATIPVLARLEGFGFVRRSTPGTRGRIEYQVTAEGRSWLKSSWRPLLQSDPPSDLEAVMRIACLARIQGGEPSVIAAYLDAAVQAKLDGVKSRGAHERIHEGAASLYREMRFKNMNARLAADIQVLKSIADDVRRQAIQPDGQNSKRPRRPSEKAARAFPTTSAIHDRTAAS